MRSALSLPVIVVALAVAPLAAQETPTEKTAAADVIRRMNELERSLALPQLVARLMGARDARRDAVVARARELMDRELARKGVEHELITVPGGAHGLGGTDPAVLMMKTF